MRFDSPSFSMSDSELSFDLVDYLLIENSGSLSNCLIVKMIIFLVKSIQNLRTT